MKNFTRSGPNVLTALLLAQTLDKEPTFQTVVAPTRSAPASVVKSTEAVVRPTNQPATQSTPPSADLPRTDSSASKHQSAGKSRSDLPQTNRPRASVFGTDLPASQTQSSNQGSCIPTRRDSISSLESDAESELSDRPPVDIYVEEGELSEDQDATITDPEQSLSEEQTYRETMRGMRSFMG